MKWHFIDTGSHSGEWNMAFDVELARRLRKGDGSPTLRFYRWQPSAISLGFNQNISDIDADACARNRIDIVRRPTGGRAILHSEELTYSVVMFSEGKNISQVYRWIGEALENGLRILNPEISMEQVQSDLQSLYRHPSAVPCFGSTSRYEIQFRGKKLVGSAQRRYLSVRGGRNEIVLQHGSILIGSGHRRLAEFIKQKGTTQELIRKSLEERTTELQSVLHRLVDVDEVAAAVKSGFNRQWGIIFDEDSNEQAA